MQHDKLKVLVVEDDSDEVLLIREAIRDVGETGITLVHAERLETALSNMDSERFDAVLLDLSLPDSFGIESVHRVVQAAGEAPVIVCTGLNDQSNGQDAIRSGAQDYLVKNPRLYGAIPRILRYTIDRSRLIHSANRKVAQARQYTELLLSKVISITNSGLGITDGEGTFVIVNPALAELVGRPMTEIVGKPWTNMLPKADQAAELRAYIDSLSHSDEYDRKRLTIQLREGSFIEVPMRSVLVDFDETRHYRILSFGRPSRSRSGGDTALTGAQFADKSKHCVADADTIHDDRRHNSLDQLIEEPATAIINDTSFALNNWNPRGFMIAPYDGRYDVGATFHVTLIMQTSGKEFKFETKAKVVRRDTRLKQLAAIFTQLDAETTKQLSELAAAKRYDSLGRPI